MMMTRRKLGEGGYSNLWRKLMTIDEICAALKTERAAAEQRLQADSGTIARLMVRCHELFKMLPPEVQEQESERLGCNTTDDEITKVGEGHQRRVFRDSTAARRLVSVWRSTANTLSKQSPLKSVYLRCADDLEAALGGS